MSLAEEVQSYSFTDLSSGLTSIVAGISICPLLLVLQCLLSCRVVFPFSLLASITFNYSVQNEIWDPSSSWAEVEIKLWSLSCWCTAGCKRRHWLYCCMGRKAQYPTPEDSKLWNPMKRSFLTTEGRWVLLLHPLSCLTIVWATSREVSPRLGIWLYIYIKRTLNST